MLQEEVEALGRGAVPGTTVPSSCPNTRVWVETTFQAKYSFVQGVECRQQNAPGSLESFLFLIICQTCPDLVLTDI